MNDTLVHELDLFFNQFKLRTYRKKDIIIHEDDIPTGVYYIKSGYVRCYTISKEGEELTRAILGPKDVFPIRWAMDSQRIDFYIEPMIDVITWCAPKEEFVSFINSKPHLFLELLAMLSTRLSYMYKRLECIVFGDTYQRVASMLVILTHQFGISTTQGIKLRVPLTHRDIASLVGVARETASIEIEELKRRNIIEDENQTIVIKDIKKLEQEALVSM